MAEILEQDQIDFLIEFEEKDKKAQYSEDVLVTKYAEKLGYPCAYDLKIKDSIISYMKDIEKYYKENVLDEDYDTFRKIYTGMYIRGWVPENNFTK